MGMVAVTETRARTYLNGLEWAANRLEVMRDDLRTRIPDQLSVIAPERRDSQRAGAEDAAAGYGDAAAAIRRVIADGVGQ